MSCGSGSLSGEGQSRLDSARQVVAERSPLEVEEISKVDLPQIEERGKLVAMTYYSPTTYFLHRGKPVGYEYELLERLAEHMGLELEIVLAQDQDRVFEALNRGEADILAHNLTVTKSRKKLVDFAAAHSTTKQVLVQRKPDNWRRVAKHITERNLVRDPLDLAGKTVHVRKGSSFYDRLLTLSEEIGEDIIIEEVDGSVSTSELIRRVAEGEIDYTVADQHVAAITQTYYDDLDVETPVSLNQRIAWAVRKTSPQLKAALNDWISQMRRQTDYYVIYNKYFKNKKAFKRRVKVNAYSPDTGEISEYDQMFRSYAKRVNWDWKLLASMAYQESRFDPKSKSWAGARGLLQVMPRTAKELGVSQLYKPENSLKAGVKYIAKMQKQWQSIPDSVERMKFVIASYNCGPGHVRDAQRLAEKLGKDPQVWTGNVEECVLKLQQRKWHSDPVVKFGYCRGREPYLYVRQIFARHQHYVKFIEQYERQAQQA